MSTALIAITLRMAAGMIINVKDVKFEVGADCLAGRLAAK
jgi:hypothetical protein